MKSFQYDNQLCNQNKQIARIQNNKLDQDRSRLIESSCSVNYADDLLPIKLIKQSFYFHSDLLQALFLTVIAVFSILIDICEVLPSQPGKSTRKIKKSKKSFKSTSKGNKQKQNPSIIGLLFNLWLAYVGLSWFFSTSLRKYLKKLKSINYFKSQYQPIRNQQLELIFQIQCYHMTGSKNKSRKVTHKATKVIQISKCVNMNSNINDEILNQIRKPFVFIEVVPTYSFANKQQQQKLEQIFQTFFNENVSDTKQDCKKIFRFKKQSKEPVVLAYYKNPIFQYLSTVFVVLNFLLLVWPAALILELFVQRHNINLQKRITINFEKQIQKKNEITEL